MKLFVTLRTTFTNPASLWCQGVQGSPAESIFIFFCMCLVCSGDELLLTEMIFNGVFNDLTVQQCVALLSCFIFEEKVNL